MSDIPSWQIVGERFEVAFTLDNADDRPQNPCGFEFDNQALPCRAARRQH
jgi:hypothetical protein